VYSFPSGKDFGRYGAGTCFKAPKPPRAVPPSKYRGGRELNFQFLVEEKAA